MNKIFLGLGSNFGDRQANLEKCINLLQNIPGLFIIKVSSIYETEPVGYILQDRFLNMVLEVDYYKTPFNLLAGIKLIEKSMCRNTSFRWGPRNIDIDILYFGGYIITTPVLCIPHSEVSKRMFVLKPLAEIAPGFLCPVSGLNMIRLREACTDESEIVQYKCFEKKPLLNNIN
ncbi:hypothetical protein AMJ80_00355 [bacterium SM23_31]|nr:MAG: hypothetical protein AMJ80_00355 [bacterium SM23_31]